MTGEPKAIDQRWLPNAALYSKMKIVVIDDEPANVALLEMMLADGGYTRVKTVTDSRLALGTCIVFEPDLVLLDLMMPHVDGFTILESLRAAAGESFLRTIQAWSFGQSAEVGQPLFFVHSPFTVAYQ